MIADVVTASRMMLSILLFVFPPSSVFFSVCYVLCGISDMLDGYIARKMHTESEKGAVLDTAADLLFAAAYAVQILPDLQLPMWIRVWTGVIAVVKLTAFWINSRKQRQLTIAHSVANKLTGLLIFQLPLFMHIVDVRYGAVIVCITATLSCVSDMTECGRKRNDEQVRTVVEQDKGRRKKQL